MKYPIIINRQYPKANPRLELQLPPPPPLRRCNDGSLLSGEEGNSNTSIVGLNLNSRTRPYYLRRCKRVRPTHIESLPNEILSDILVRLPADHLYDRARLVCRRWYHIIHSYDFVNTQIQHSTYELFLSHQSCHHPILISATQGGRIEISEFSYFSKTCLLNCSNGLCVGIYGVKSFPYIINPSTKHYFSLPSFPDHNTIDYMCCMAFAPRSMKYKLTLPYYNNRRLRLAILTFGVDNSWRDVALDSMPGRALRCYLDFQPLVTEGFIHWTFRSWRFVYTLDIETEMFSMSEILFPREYGKETNRYYLSTGRFLSLLVGNGDFSWDVWGMKSETGEWTKVLPGIKLGAQKRRIQQLASAREGQVLKPIGWVKYPEVLALCFKRESRTCIFYNLDTHEINSAELPRPCADYYAIVHKNNLTCLS